MFNPNDPNDAYWQQRRSSQADSDEPRTPWQRDFGRVVHSASFRRLQGKTQILGVDHGDFHRTRLTHSLEVSQIGASILQKLDSCLDESHSAKKWLPNLFLIHVICLAHDLGHPPFGHGGEVALNRCLLKKGGFEANGQTLRIVTKLEKYTQGFGMDLTRRSVLGMIKYFRSYSVSATQNIDCNCEQHGSNEEIKGRPYKAKLPGGPLFNSEEFKPPKCYLDDEHEDIVLGWVANGLEDWITRLKDTSGSIRNDTAHGSLDASIMNLADDIAYGVHDLEDAIALKLIDRYAFMEWFDKCESYKGRVEPLIDHCSNGSFEKFVDDLFGDTHTRKRTISLMVAFFVQLIEIIEVVTCRLSCPMFNYQAKLCSNSAEDALKVLMMIVRQLVIESPEVQQLDFKGQKIVTELYEAFVTDPKRLLERQVYERTRQGGGEVNTERVVCDYIAGMTDDYAITRYRQLFVPRAGSVFDRL